MLALVGALLLGAAVFYIVFSTQVTAAANEAESRLASEWGNDTVLPQLPFYIRLMRPLLMGGTLNIAASFWSEKQLIDWKRQLVACGLAKYVEPTHLVASKFWLSFVVGFFMFLMMVFSSDPPNPWFAVGMTAFVFFMPNMDINSRRQFRQRQIRLAMPYMVDLLTLSIEAGLDFMGAIAKVVDRAPPSALTEELSVVLKDIQLGKTRAMSLRSFAARTDMSEVGSFVAILVSADSMGASIGTVLRAQSESMRNERLTKAEKMGAQASQKMLIPLVFFILPAVMLIIFGPLILGFMGQK